ncbi:MAG: hypothetical protein QOE80_565 [Actinomycetota bacterium]|nr:hypothetical protein [Actinomycetota bacterium]
MTNNKIMAAVITGSLLAGGALGLTMFGPSLASAQTTGTTAPAATASPAPSGTPGGTFSSNEDPAHEAGESAQREADENSGKAFGGHHGSNEDPAHEASESPAREAEEDAANAASGAPSSSTAPAASDSTLQ